MPESLDGWKRTHHNNELRIEDIGKEVLLMGWVAKRAAVSRLQWPLRLCR